MNEYHEQLLNKTLAVIRENGPISYAGLYPFVGCGKESIRALVCELRAMGLIVSEPMVVNDLVSKHNKLVHRIKPRVE